VWCENITKTLDFAEKNTGSGAKNEHLHARAVAEPWETSSKPRNYMNTGIYSSRVVLPWRCISKVASPPDGV
jgi:hypothetical protein